MAPRSVHAALAATVVALAPASAAQATVEWRISIPDAAAGAGDVRRAAVSAAGDVYLVLEGQASTLEKLAPDGAKLWQLRLPLLSVFGLATDPSGGAVVAGNHAAGGPGALVLGITPAGALSWRATLPDVNGRALALDAMGRSVVCGSAGGDWFVAALAADGTLRWTQHVDGSAHFASDVAYCVALGTGGEVFVGGAFGSYASYTDAAVAKISADGALAWQRAWSLGYDSEHYDSIVADRRGGAVAAGSVEITLGKWPPIHYLNHQFTRFDADGAIDWSHPAWGEPMQSDARDVVIDATDVVWAVSHVEPQGWQPPSVLLERITLDGVPLGEWYFSGPSNEGAWPVDLALAPAGEVLLAATYGTYFTCPANPCAILGLGADGQPAWTTVLEGSSVGLLAAGLVPALPDGVLLFGSECVSPSEDGDDFVTKLALSAAPRLAR